MSKKLVLILIMICVLLGGIFIVNRLSEDADYVTEESHAEFLEELSEEFLEELEESDNYVSAQINIEGIHYIRTLAGTEIFDSDSRPLGILGENQTFAASAVGNDQLLKLSDLPFYVNFYQVEVVTEFQDARLIELDLSRYLAFEQMIPRGSAVDFYHLDQSFAFSLNETDVDITIYMQNVEQFYVRYLDMYFLVAQADVPLVANPDALPERTSIPVLMYHFFCNSAEEVECRDSNWIERDHFEEHMQYLRDNNFTTLKMVDIERFLAGFVRLPERSVAITIDDAHWSMFEYAYSILVETNQIATTFAITHHDRDWETLMLSDHLEFHSHSHDMHRGHCDAGRGGLMQCIDFDEGVADLMESRSLLNDTTVFCYPFGDYNDHAIAMLQEAGFTLAFTTEPGLVTRDSEALLLPRIRISTDTHLPQFSYLVRQ